MIGKTPLFQDAAINQIWDSYVKEYRRYAPDSVRILETISEVKVTATQGWYVTLCHPKMHALIKFALPSNYIRNISQT